MAKKPKEPTLQPLPTPVQGTLPPEKIPAAWTPAFKPEPIVAGNWWPWTSRYIKVLRHKKTGQMRIDSCVYSIKPECPPGSQSNVADHEVMMVIDLTEFLGE